MKIASLFSLLTDTTGLLDFFEGVETTDQLITRLERLKRQGTEELLDSLYAARNSVTEVLDDTLETSSALGWPDDDLEGETLPDKELEALAAAADTPEAAETAGDEDQILPTPPASENENS